MKQYVNPVELTAELLNTLIEKITVHEAVKGEDGSREQEVEIYYLSCLLYTSMAATDLEGTTGTEKSGTLVNTEKAESRRAGSCC